MKKKKEEREENKWLRNAASVIKEGDEHLLLNLGD